MKNNYGELPKDLGKFDINWNESCFYLYLPIKMAQSWDVKIPERLKPFRNLLWPIYHKAMFEGNQKFYAKYRNSYLYLTVKHMLVNPDFWGNRGGAHCDGFGTDDINWIWYDANPTEFNFFPFKVSEHEHESLKQFEEQWSHEHTVTYPEKHLLELSPFVVHRVARVTRYQMRTFVKISLSKHKYNLVGNSHNYLFDYDWKMFDRQSLRNRTHNNNADYVPMDVA